MYWTRSTSLGLGIALGRLLVGLSSGFLGAVTPDDLSDPRWQSLALGDLNGDGKSDLLVGGLNLSALGRSGNGWVYLLSGLFPSGTGNRLDLNAASSRQFGGPTDNAFAGHAVGVGDLNHGGRQDIVVGCPAYPNSAVCVVYQSVFLP